MSILILYYKVTPEKICSAQLYELINNWSEELPAQKREQISKLRQQSDQVLSLAGLQLLKIGMAQFTDIPFSLKQLQFPAKNKPFFDGDVDFNISHSGNIAICAISNNMKIGIDIELQRQVKSAIVNKFLSEKNNKTHKSEEKNKQQFFELWTKNEAIIKAANHGSIFTMHEISLQNQGGFYQDHFWYTYPVNINTTDNHSSDINKEYTCHIACSEKITGNELKKIKPKQIHNISKRS